MNRKYLETVVYEEGLVGEREKEILLGGGGGRGRRGGSRENFRVMRREEGLPKSVGFGGRTEGGRHQGEPAGVARTRERKDGGDASLRQIGPRE